MFWNKFTQKWYFQSKTEKVNIIIEFCIFELVQVSIFNLNNIFLILGPYIFKAGISGNKKKIEKETS